MNAIDVTESTTRKARVEIIPLIDVIFFLLATFVLFTLSLNKIASVDAPLPQAGKETGEEFTTVFIQASESGTFYWKLGRWGASELISETELGPRLADYRRQVAAPRILVRGDTKAKFGPVVRVLDEVRKAGIRQVSVETTPTASGS